MVQPVSSEARRSRMSGVLPMRLDEAVADGHGPTIRKRVRGSSRRRGGAIDGGYIVVRAGAGTQAAIEIRPPMPCRSIALALALADQWLALPGARRIPRDVVVMAKRIDDMVSLYPAEAYEFSDEEAIANLYDRLLDYDPAHPETIRGALAPIVGGRCGRDGAIASLLRPDARFASGRPVTAEDAAFSLPAHRPARFDARLRAAPVRLHRVRMSRRAFAPRTRTTLIIDTAVKVAPSLLYYVLTSSIASVIDRTEAMAHQQDGDLGHRWLAIHSAGSGPYRLKIWRPGERYVLDAVPDAGAGRRRTAR